MSEAFDAIIIGGGLFGSFTAFFLARAGQRVALIERGLVGAQASGANFGGLRLQGRSPEQYPLSLLAQSHWESFDKLIGEGVEYDANGMIYIAKSDDSRERLLKYAKNSKACGLDIEIWQGEALRANMPWITDPDLLASYSPRCAVANPRLSTAAVARAMLRHGGTLYENSEVVGVAHNGQGFTVRTANGLKLHAPQLLNAAGGWSGALAAQFGDHVPLFSAGPPQFVTEPLPYILRPSLYTIEGDMILRQIPRGNFIFAGYPRSMAEPDGRHTFVPPHKTLSGMAAALHYIPGLANAEVIRVWSGVEGYLPDMLPVIGPSKQVEGLYHAFGGSGGGFQISPAVGDCLAQLMRGGTSPVDLSPYAIDRFGQDLAVSEKLKLEFDAASPAS